MKRYLSVPVFVLIGCFVITGIQAETKLTDPYQILQRYFDAIGGLEKLKAEKTSYSEATISIAGLQGTVRQWFQMPNRKRQELDLKVFKQTGGDNGQVSWVQDANGKITILQDEATLKRRKIEELANLYDYADPRSPNFTLTFEGIQKVGTNDCYVIKRANKINDDIVLEFYNSSNFLLEKSINKLPDQETTNLFSDYRDVSGVMRPFHQETTEMPVNQQMTSQLTEYEVNPDIDPALFEPPVNDVKDYRFTVGTSSENIPFQYIGEHLYIPVVINCKERLWILDSGAGMTTIDVAYVKELGLKAEGNLKGQGAGQTVDVSFVTLPPYSLQGIQFDSQKVACIDIQPFFKRFGLNVAGILGYDFLSRFVTKVDYANKTLSFYEPDKFEYKGNGRMVSAPLKGNMFAVPATVDGEYSGDWNIDLGAGSNSFHYPFAKEHGFVSRRGVERSGMGAGGTFQEKSSQFQTIEFAGFTVPKPIFDFATEELSGAFSSKELVGNLGNTLFRHFVLYMDYKNQRLIVEQGADFDTVFPTDRSGLQIWFNDDGKYEIWTAAPGAPGAKAGFKAGDVIVSINDIDMVCFSNIFAVGDLLKKDPGTQYKFKILRDGQPMELKLKLENIY